MGTRAGPAVVARSSVAVVATVINEATNIAEWLDALLEQSLLPDEVVIVDGGSTDQTVSAIERRAASTTVPIIINVKHGANISEGRNIAIDQSTAQFIAVTDAGTIADRYWLERLTSPLIGGEVDVASGFFSPRLVSRWERALAATTLPDASEIDAQSFLPSSRSVAFRREWFIAGLRYPEWLDYCEDLVWDLSMARAGARFRFVPDARVTFAVRQSLRSYVVQYARYARGDGKAGLFARRHAIRYLTYAVLIVVLRRRRVPEILVMSVCGCTYVARPVIRLWSRDRRLGRTRRETLALVPLVVALRTIGDVAKMTGYPAGLVWRWRRYGGLGWRTAWPRISPSGDLFLPAAMTKESRPQAASLSGESPGGSR